MNLEELARQAEQILAIRWGCSARLSPLRQLSRPGRRNLVVLCDVRDGTSEMPRTMVVKQAGGADYRPDDPQSPAAWGLFRDWAGLDFLATLPGWQGSPRLYGGDRLAGVFVMEDLTAFPDLDSVLSGGSSQEAVASLTLLAETLGRLHALTIGKAHEYQRFRDVLGPGDQAPRLAPAHYLRQCAPRLAGQFRRLGVEVPGAFLADIETIAAALENPGPFLAYSHGDPCPENCRLVGGRLCLLDYEFGGFRQSLLDGVCGRMRFPTGWSVRDIPEPVVAEMEVAYRRELAKTCPAADDEALYCKAIADTCGYWIMDNLAHLLPQAIQFARPMGLATNRQRILTRLTAFLSAADKTGQLPGLQHTMGRLLETLDRRWGEKMPVYDALLDRTDLPAPT